MKEKLLQGYNLDIARQTEILEEILMSNKIISEALVRIKQLELEHYYIGAGCIAQTVWNHLSGKPLDYGIKDIDLVYFDDSHLDYESENSIIIKAKDIFSDFNIEIDVKNQARVHLWYKSRFGYVIEPYGTLEAAINTWPTTATAIGIRQGLSNEFLVYAPFGLNDLLGGIVRANKAQITKGIYEDKIARWVTKWPDLIVIPWEK